MRKMLAALIVPAVLSVSVPVAHAGHEPFRPAVVALGLGLGDPTALDLKLWVTPSSGFDFGFGVSRWSDRLGVYGEFEFGLVDFWIGNDVMGVFYLGVGGAVGLNGNAVAFEDRHDGVSLALVIPIGVNFRFRVPLEVFVEARPGFEILDPGGFGVGGQVGIRYVF